MVRINSCVLNVEFEPFRAYERGVSSTQQNVQSTTTTGSQVYSSTSENTQTQSTSSQSSQTPTTSTTQSNTPTTSSQAQQTPTTSSGGGSTQSSESVSLPASQIQTVNDPYNTSNHNHGIAHLVRLATVNAQGQVNGSISWVPSGAHSHGAHNHSVNIQAHSHTVTIPAHSHTVSIAGHSHTVTIPSHSHTVTIPGHSHTVSIPGHSHTVTIPAHTHSMEYGIFKAGSVNAGQLFINGKYIQDILPNTNINIANMLADEKTRKISRNTFHRIEIVPIATTNNPQGLTRIVANIFMQIFTNSRGSGDF
jgi:hypothetical protein